MTSSALPSWLAPHDLENLAPVAMALTAGAVLQWSLPDSLVLLHPGWLLPVLELALVAAFVVVDLGPWDVSLRPLSLLLAGLISSDNTLSSVLLILTLLHVLPGGAHELDALHLIISGGAIYITNVLAYGIWYWQLDRGGARARAAGAAQHPEWLFAQMTLPPEQVGRWHPQFLDYLYLSFTNATAFSPTDTLPLSRRAKALMALQSLVALGTMALVLARAVNILQ